MTELILNLLFLNSHLLYALTREKSEHFEHNTFEQGAHISQKFLVTSNTINN